jgi:hypothetical protein
MTLQNTLNLGKVNQQELTSIRHIINEHQTMAKKLDFYSNQCQDPQLKQLFKQSSQAATTTASNLLNSLK